MMTLITGSSGFVGSYLANLDNVIALDASVDITNELEVTEFVIKNKIVNVIHLAAQSFVPESFRDPKRTFDVNFTGTYNLLQSLTKHGFSGRFLYISTSDVYGIVSESELPIDETMLLRPRSPYAVSKISAEALCYQWGVTNGFDALILRPFNHIGPGQDEHFVISDFAKQLTEIKLGLRSPVIHVGDIDVSRDFTDVRDVVAAYKLLLEKGTGGEIYNICSGVGRTIRSLLDKMIEIIDVNVDIIQDRERLRKSEQRVVCGDSTKLSSITGWKPSITIDQSIKDILNYWKRQLDV